MNVQTFLSLRMEFFPFVFRIGSEDLKKVDGVSLKSMVMFKDPTGQQIIDELLAHPEHEEMPLKMRALKYDGMPVDVMIPSLMNVKAVVERVAEECKK